MHIICEWECASERDREYKRQQQNDMVGDLWGFMVRATNDCNDEVAMHNDLQSSHGHISHLLFLFSFSQLNFRNGILCIL
jgi:hypothetical protein